MGLFPVWAIESRDYEHSFAGICVNTVFISLVNTYQWDAWVIGQLWLARQGLYQLTFRPAMREVPVALNPHQHMKLSVFLNF